MNARLNATYVNPIFRDSEQGFGAWKLERDAVWERGSAPRGRPSTAKGYRAFVRTVLAKVTPVNHLEP